MKIGMPTLIEFNTLKENIFLAEKLNLDFIELNLNLPEFQIDNINQKDILYFLNQNKFFTIHLNENFNFSDFDEDIKKGQLESLKKILDFANKFNVPIINFHLLKGIYFTLPNKKIYLFEKFREVYFKNAFKLIDLFKSHLDINKTFVCIENTDGFEKFRLDVLEIFLKEKFIYLTYDIGHDYSINDFDKKFLYSNQNKIKHFHIHDATRLKNHLTLGEGEIDLKEKINLSKKLNCTNVIEVKESNSLINSIQFLNKNIF